MTEHIYAHEHPESDRRREGGFTLWFTGLSGSGKSTIAHLVGPELDRRGWVASRLTRQGGAVLAAAISPYEETRRRARQLVEEWGAFVEVHVKASVDECARRDVKGLYAKAFAGEIKGFTGVDDPYEVPTNAEIVIDTEEHDPEESARLILARLEELG